MDKFRVEEKELLFRGNILLPPVTKKNSQRILKNPRTGKRFIAPSEVYKRYEKNAGYFLRKPNEPIKERVNVKALYFMKTRRKVDISNLHSALHDALVCHGIVEDDNSNIIISTDGSRVYYDKYDPRTEIYITKGD